MTTTKRPEWHTVPRDNEDDREVGDKWATALWDEREMLKARKGTSQEKGTEDRRVKEITHLIDGDDEPRKAKPRTATRGHGAQTRAKAAKAADAESESESESDAGE